MAEPQAESSALSQFVPFFEHIASVVQTALEIASWIVIAVFFVAVGWHGLQLPHR